MATNTLWNMLRHADAEYKANNKATLSFSAFSDASDVDKRRVDMVNDFIASGYYGAGLGTDSPWLAKEYEDGIKVVIVFGWNRATYDRIIIQNGQQTKNRVRI